MSNTIVRTVEFDNKTLVYINEEGTGSPLFLVQALAQAFGISLTSGYWYKPELKPFKVKRRLKPGKKKQSFISIDGVYKLLEWRQPLWEQKFRDQFVIFGNEPIEDSLNTQEDKGPDNLEADPFPLPEPMESTLLPAIIERMDRQDKIIERLTDAVETLQVTSGPTFLDVPRKAGLLHAFVTVNDCAGSSGRTLYNEPIYAHVPGYRTYKEFFEAMGLSEHIGTTFGRVVSSKLAHVCKKHCINYYLVLDANRLGKRSGRYKNARNVHDSLPNYSINSYPQELWDVMKPTIQQMIDVQCEKC